MDGELPFSMMDVIVLLNLPYPPSGRASYNINCPCCDTHNKRHLNINFTKGVFRCPRCGFAGGVLDLYSHYANMDRAQAYKAIMDKMGIDSASPAKMRPHYAAMPEINECPMAGIEERDATYRAFLNRLWPRIIGITL